ncbi:uncharacterized protein LOC134722993 [Mytilus trossulus]|uniref:uncharacterized protein LOC134722993 n=1 Tax=Mytilus trossulus TaxID=6551 RepID=UPI0030072E9A
MVDKYEEEMPYAELGSPTRQNCINNPAQRVGNSGAPPLPPRRPTTFLKSYEHTSYSDATSLQKDRHDFRGSLSDSEVNLYSNNLRLNDSVGSNTSVCSAHTAFTYLSIGLKRTAGSPETDRNLLYSSIRSPTGGFSRVPSEYQLLSDLPISKEFQSTTVNRFVPTKGLESDDNTSGIFVKDSLHFPPEDWSLTIDELIQFNTLPGAIEDLRQQDFKRYIVTKVLPRLRRTNIEGIAKLLHIGSETITDIVIPVLFEETIETELYCGNAEDFYQAFNAVIEVFTIANSSPDLLLILFNLASIIRRKYSENQMTLKTNMCKKCQKRYRSLRTSKVCHRLSAIKLLTEQMQSSTKWEIPKSSAEGQSFPTTNFVDQYSHLFGIINKIFLSTDCSKYVEELKCTTRLLVEKKHKPQSENSTFQDIILRLVTTGCYLLLRNDTYLELQSKERLEGLFDVLDLILMNTNVLQETRMSLMTVLEPLFLVENTEIVQRILRVFINNHKKSVPVSRLVQQYTMKELLYTGITFPNYTCLNEREPKWITTKGILSYNDKEILLYCLMPTLHCLSQGKITECQPAACKKEKHVHINSLQMLTYLQHGKTHNSVIQLLAYQIHPLPLFYITERISSLTLNEFLLRKRKQSKWQTYKMLTSLVMEIVDVVIFLKDRGIVHRDLTSHAFRICDGGQRIVLHDFSIALKLDGKDFIQGKNLINLYFCYYYTADDYRLIPTLWSAPESILEDKYSVKSDAWMVGHLLYEVFTHGCQPYTEMYTFGIDKVLSYVVFHNLQPKQWQCIPKCIYELIIALLQRNPEDRRDLSEIQHKLKETVDSYSNQGSRRRHLSLRSEENELYPSIDPKQDLPRNVSFNAEDEKTNYKLIGGASSGMIDFNLSFPKLSFSTKIGKICISKFRHRHKYKL